MWWTVVLFAETYFTMNNYYPNITLQINTNIAKYDLHSTFLYFSWQCILINYYALD